ncbi:hypothetical protein [Nocardia sp. NBC_00511]|uniref:hypothetical protein n=1 Tax=Nocardia sp. NBC_00511 TaxID=2903591 RepID=UPI0030E59296
MSQQKDSESGANLEKPANPPVPETTPESSPTADVTADIDETTAAVTDDTATDAVDAETATAAVESDAEPTVALNKPVPPVEASASSGMDSRKAVTLGAVALAVVAAVAAAWFGGTWITGLVQDRPRAHARDEALAAAQQAAINITSMKMSDIDGSLAVARSSMTGDLLDASTKNADQLKQKITESNVDAASKVVGGSLTALNSERNQASALIVMEVTETAPGKQANKTRFTWSVEVVVVKGVWKADQIQVVSDPVALNSGAAPTAAPQQSAAPQPTKQPGN